MAYSRAAYTEETAKILAAVAKEVASLNGRGVVPRRRPGVTGPTKTILGMAISTVAKRHRLRYRVVYSAVWRDRNRRAAAGQR